jgi:SAM-dependent methyltransferase
MIKRWKAQLRNKLEKHPLGYRLLLKREGLPFFPGRVSAAWMNTTLKSKKEWQAAEEKIKGAGLRPHGDSPKNWDHLAALSYILKHKGKTARVLDAGGDSESPLVEWLFLYGYRSLHVINLAFSYDFARGPIRYIKGDCTRTSYPADYFDAITCLSVIEHGVPLKAFLKESHRIMRPGGFLIVSTDYWNNRIDTQGKKAFGVEVKVFTQEDIQEFIDLARKIGFTLTGNVDFTTEEKAVHWQDVGLDFTFIVLALQKE